MPTMARCDHGEYIATHAGIYFESICLVLCSFLASPNCAGKFSKVISSDKFSGTASERRVAAVRGARVQCCCSLGKYNITFHLFFFFVRWQPQVKNTWPMPLAPQPFNAEQSVCTSSDDAHFRSYFFWFRSVAIFRLLLLPDVLHALLVCRTRRVIILRMPHSHKPLRWEIDHDLIHLFCLFL